MIRKKENLKTFIPFRCEDCIYGIYNPYDSCWEDGCHVEDEKECEELFEEE